MEQRHAGVLARNPGPASPAALNLPSTPCNLCFETEAHRAEVARIYRAAREENMLDHIILTVSDIERSLEFYKAALKPLKIEMFLPYKGTDGHPDLWGFGDGGKAFFWLKQGKPDPASIHWGFVAENNNMVDAFYKAAIAAGAKENISPRARLEYYPGYYAADVFDPDGYTFEVVHKS
jgi:catechol 2,3-dioxygenase-like lactoylglutathione lyase family enzyme